MERNSKELDKRTEYIRGEQPSGGQMSADPIYRKALRLCLSEGRMSYRRMASELRVSTTTVASHIAKLEREGVIRGFSAMVDYQKLGYELTVVTEILVSKGKLLETDREIAKLPGVCAVYDTTGETDGIIIAKFKNRDELSHFTKGLLALPYVERTNTHVVLTTVKEDFRLAV